jgi:ABC-type tungstate transport system substrate-binding protein
MLGVKSGDFGLGGLLFTNDASSMCGRMIVASICIISALSLLRVHSIESKNRETAVPDA